MSVEAVRTFERWCKTFGWGQAVVTVTLFALLGLLISDVRENRQDAREARTLNQQGFERLSDDINGLTRVMVATSQGKAVYFDGVAPTGIEPEPAHPSAKSYIIVPPTLPNDVGGDPTKAPGPPPK
jgi:hypothetical protein